MGDSTRLLRSFSNPTDTSSCLAKEGDYFCLLGESISFGRYMSERLDWDKYSTFSHNRYVEEAENFSIPGSVAEKKAYFEAHYKKKAAQKVAALVHEAAASVNETFDSKTRDGNCSSSSTEINSKEKNNVLSNERLEIDAVSYHVVDYVDTNRDKCDIEQNEVDNFKVETPEDEPQPLVDTNLDVEISVVIDNSNQFDNVEEIAVPSEEKMADVGNPWQVKREEVNSSPTLSTTAPRTSYSPAERKATVQSRSRISDAPKSKRSGGDSAEKKRLSARSIHMSINLPSCAGEATKTASVLQQNRIKKVNSNFSTISRDHLVASRTSIRASKDVFNQASANPKIEARRTDRLLKKSACRGVTASATLPFVDSPKFSSTSNPQSSTVSSPFRFRSEERAAKRKEFFQRMEEIKLKEAEKEQLQRRCKEKTEHDHKLQLSSGVKPKLNEDRNGGLQFPSNEIRKTSLTQPKATSTCHGKNPRSSWRPPISTNTFKRVAEKINQTRRPVTLLSKKTTQENVAPNIQC